MTVTADEAPPPPLPPGPPPNLPTGMPGTPPAGVPVAPRTLQPRASGLSGPPPMVNYQPKIDALTGQLEGVGKDIDALTKTRDEAIRPLEDERARASAKLSADAHQQPKTEPLPDTPKPIPAKDYMENATWMMVLAGLAGGLTRAPLTAALGNMTGVMKGAQAASAENFKQEMEQFKANYQKAIDTNTARIADYNRIIKADDLSLQEKVSQLESAAARWHDGLTAAQARSNNIDAVLKTVEASQNAQTHAQEHHDRLIEQMQNYQLRLESMRQTRELELMRIAATQEKADKSSPEYKLQQLDDMKARGLLSEEEATIMRERIVGGGKPVRINEQRSTNQAAVMGLANYEMQDLLDKGVRLPAFANLTFDKNGVLGVVGDQGQKLALTDDQQKLLTSARMYAEEGGHSVAGARLTDSQMARFIQEFIPTAGDKDGVIEMKNVHRQNLITAVLITAGPLRGQAEEIAKSAWEKERSGQKSQEPISWLTRSMRANPDMSRDEIVAEGKKSGRLPQEFQ